MYLRAQRSLVVLCTFVGACATDAGTVADGGVGPPSDAAVSDAAVSDATVSDATVSDAAVSDAAANDAATVAYVSVPSGVHGAGGTNGLALDPFLPTHLLAIGDVSGVHRSVDRGEHFRNASRGMSIPTHLNGVSIRFSALDPGRVFYLAGNRGEPQSGGLFASSDHGETWSLQSDAPEVSASDNPRDAALAGQPRLIGNLLELDERQTANGIERVIYVGTMTQGLLRSTDDGVTWASVSMPAWPSPAYITGLRLVRRSGASSFVFVAVRNEGLWRVELDAATGEVLATTHLVNAPSTIEELDGNEHLLIAAAGADGAYLSTDSGASFSIAPIASLFSPGPIKGRWNAVAVRPSASAATTDVWLGCYSLPTNRCSLSVIHSVDGGATWAAPFSGALTLPISLAGRSEPYWFTDGRTQTAPIVPHSVINGDNQKVYQIALDPSDDATVYLAANGTPWRSTDRGVSWQPICFGLGATVATTVAYDPFVPDRAMLGLYDWSTLRATQGLSEIRWLRPAEDTRTGRAFAFFEVAPGDTQVVMALALQDNGAVGATLGGSIWSSTPELFAQTPSSTVWNDEQLDEVTDGRTVGVAVGRDALGARVLIASVANGSKADRENSSHACNLESGIDRLGCAGVFRKVGAGAWTQVLSSVDILANSFDRAPIAWPRGSSRVYFLDRSSGVFASDDYGATFARIRNYASGSSGRSRTGHLAVDPTDETRIYVTIGGADIERIEAGTTTTWSLPGGATPGPLAVSSTGELWVASEASAGHAAALWRSVDRGATFVNEADERFSAQALFPTDLSISSTGRIALSLWGTGFIEVLRP